MNEFTVYFKFNGKPNRTAYRTMANRPWEAVAYCKYYFGDVEIISVVETWELANSMTPVESLKMETVYDPSKL